jgi:hypothetical protein
MVYARISAQDNARRCAKSREGFYPSFRLGKLSSSLSIATMPSLDSTAAQ